MEDVVRVNWGRRTFGAGLGALLAVPVAMALPASDAFAGASGCGSKDRAHNIQTLSPATCADASSVVASYYPNPSCFAGGQTQQSCGFSTGSKTWQCSANSGAVQCQSPNYPGSDVPGLVKWTDGPPVLNAIRGLALSPTAFRALSSGGPIANSGGTQVSFRLESAARVTFSIFSVAPGRKVGPGPFGCRPQTPANRTRPRCTITQGRGAFQRPSTAGLNKFRFSGRVAGRKLAPGSYQLRAQLENETKVVTKAFRILAPPRR